MSRVRAADLGWRVPDNPVIGFDTKRKRLRHAAAHHHPPGLPGSWAADVKTLQLAMSGEANPAKGSDPAEPHPATLHGQTEKTLIRPEKTLIRRNYR
ncbi:MAG TPA: hypothetical protein VE462_02325 [Propionibacteriaceae bacterium]|nr:hypothetical protein [Propionibacteriaceae bacterium]